MNVLPGFISSCRKKRLEIICCKGEGIMKTERLLGKIDFAEFGTFKDFPFLIGVQLGFTMRCCGVMDGGKYTVNISPDCKWGDANQADAITRMVEKVNEILKDARVNYVSELVNKPVEVTIINGRFEDFRILTEVL
jgi:hypothetical protein